MSEDEFTKLFKYVQEFRAEMSTKLDEKAIDGFVKRLDVSETEQATRDLQFDRLLD